MIYQSLVNLPVYITRLVTKWVFKRILNKDPLIITELGNMVNFINYSYKIYKSTRLYGKFYKSLLHTLINILFTSLYIEDPDWSGLGRLRNESEIGHYYPVRENDGTFGDHGSNLRESQTYECGSRIRRLLPSPGKLKLSTKETSVISGNIFIRKSR